MHKTLTFVLLVCLLGWSGVVFAGDDYPPLRVAVDAPYPPFAMVDKRGNLTGFDVDIANALCAELKRTCIIKSVPFDAIIPAIVAGEIDIAVSGMSPTSERLKFVDFTDKYFRSLSIYLEKKGSGHTLSPEGLKGLRLGAYKGTIQEEYLYKRFNATSTIVRGENNDVLMAMLRDGRVDLVLTDGLAGYVMLKSASGDDLEIVGDPVESGDVMDSSCIAVSRKLPELRLAINNAIQSLRRSGEYGKINRKYFNFNIY